MFKLVNFNLRQHDRSGLRDAPNDAGRGEWLLSIQADAGHDADLAIAGWLGVGSDQASQGVGEVVTAWQQSIAVGKAKRLAEDLRAAQSESDTQQRERDRLAHEIDEALTAGRPVEALENEAVAVGLRLEIVGKRLVSLRRLALEAKREALAELKAALQQRLDLDRVEALEVQRLEHEGLVAAIEELLPQVAAARRMASALSPDHISETIENTIADAAGELTLPGESLMPEGQATPNQPRQRRETIIRPNWTPLRAA